MSSKSSPPLPGAFIYNEIWGLQIYIVISHTNDGNIIALRSDCIIQEIGIFDTDTIINLKEYDASV